MSERGRVLAGSLLAMLALALLLSVGCDQAPDNASALPPRQDVQLVTVDRDGYDAALAKHRGQVVLVDFWATWCRPCVEQLAHTTELARRLGNQGLATVTVSLDAPEQSEQVVELLRSRGAAGLTNLISRYGASPQSMTAFGIDHGAVPHYKIYDRKGELRHRFGIDPAAERQFMPADIDAAIEQLLAE